MSTAADLSTEATARPDVPEGESVTNVTVNAPTAERVQLDTDDIAGVLSHIPEVVKETKEGYKTTEFWVTIVIGLLTVLNGIPLPEKFEGAVVAALAIAYTLSRGLAKKGVPVVESAVPLAD